MRVAAIAASEKVHPSQPATTDAAALREEWASGDGTVLVDGPFGYDVALSPAAEKKGFAASLVAGQADLLGQRVVVLDGDVFGVRGEVRQECQKIVVRTGGIVKSCG